MSVLERRIAHRATRTRRGLVAGCLVLLAACGGQGNASTVPTSSAAASAPVQAASPAIESPATTFPVPPGQTFLIDTDVAADDLVALSFMLSAPNVTLVAITVSGTGEAHCAGGVAVVLGLLEYLEAPAIPVACGRDTPLVGDHAFPVGWREAVDRGSGLQLPATDRVPVEGNAVELIKGIAGDHPGLSILTLGPLTNLGDALENNPDLASRIGPVFIMGGAVHVPGNLLGPGAPTGNTAAEWNVYVDPHAVAVVIASGVQPTFVGLDGTSQVPLTTAFAQRAIQTASRPASSILAQLLNANPFMSSGSSFLWDPLAAEVSAGYAVGTTTPATIKVEEAEGPESGFTRPADGDPNIRYLSGADPSAAENTMLQVLDGP